jgi:hypothetical protein
MIVPLLFSPHYQGSKITPTNFSEILIFQMDVLRDMAKWVIPFQWMKINFYKKYRGKSTLLSTIDFSCYWLSYFVKCVHTHTYTHSSITFKHLEQGLNWPQHNKLFQITYLQILLVCWGYVVCMQILRSAYMVVIGKSEDSRCKT